MKSVNFMVENVTDFFVEGFPKRKGFKGEEFSLTKGEKLLLI